MVRSGCGKKILLEEELEDEFVVLVLKSAVNGPSGRWSLELCASEQIGTSEPKICCAICDFCIQSGTYQPRQKCLSICFF